MFFPPFRPAFSPTFRPAFSPAFRLLSRLPSFLSAFDLSFDVSSADQVNRVLARSSCEISYLFFFHLWLCVCFSQYVAFRASFTELVRPFFGRILGVRMCGCVGVGDVGVRGCGCTWV